MNTPKRRHSKARRDKRRANWKLTGTNLVSCSHCGASSLPHRVCAECGFYGGREVVAVDA